MRWTLLLLLPGCVGGHSTVCTEDEYRTLKGDCHPVTTTVGDTGSVTLPDLDADADTDTDTDTDTDSDTDTDTDTDTDLIQSIDVSCDSTKWYYSVSTVDPAGSVELHVVHTGLDDTTERHTLQLTGTSETDGGVFERDLFLVADYYYENTATQFACVDGSNPNLTWRVDLYTDPSFTSQIGCVTWGHDPSHYLDNGCMEWEE